LADKSLNWTPEELAQIELMSSYKEAVALALRKLQTAPQPVAQVCGPITTGGRCSIKGNLRLMRQGILWLASQGKPVFDQTVFGPLFQKVRMAKGGEYDKAVLDEFYLILFESKLVGELHFLPGWQTSFGANWEHQQALRLGLSIVFMPAFLLP